jgi:hypothetical protein
MQSIFDQFRENIIAAFDPGQHLCVDECLYAYRGNCPFRQYIPSKPAKYGIKFWCLVCNKTKYLLDVYPYLGKQNKYDGKLYYKFKTALLNSRKSQCQRQKSNWNRRHCGQESCGTIYQY